MILEMFSVCSKRKIILEQNYICDMHDINHMNYLSERNSLQNVLNPYKNIRIKIPHYPPILHGCIDTHRGKAK